MNLIEDDRYGETVVNAVVDEYGAVESNLFIDGLFIDLVERSPFEMTDSKS